MPDSDAVSAHPSIMKRVLLPRVASAFRVPSPPGLRDLGGFTLIEITIAITIASLALVGLLGMVPQGLRTMKMASDLAIEARIHQQIMSELTQTDWDKRHDYHNEVVFFDDQGIQVTERQNQADPELYPLVYTVRILVPREGEVLPAKLTASNGTRPLFKAFDSSDLMQVGSSSGSGSGSSFDGVQLVLMEISTSDNVRVSADFDKSVNERSIHLYRGTLTRATKL